MKVAVFIALFPLISCKNPSLGTTDSGVLAWTETTEARLIAKQETKLKLDPSTSGDSVRYCSVPAGTELAILRYDDQFVGNKHVKVLFNTTLAFADCQWAADAAAKSLGTVEEPDPVSTPTARITPSYTSVFSDDVSDVEVVEVDDPAPDEGSPIDAPDSYDYQGYIWLEHFRPAAANTSIKMKTVETPKGFEGGSVDVDLGQRLAQYVHSNRVGFRGRCWTYVQRAVNAVILRQAASTVSLPGNSEHNINRLSESRFRMCRAKSTELASLPVGSILIYKPGTCGYSRTAGHGEIKVSQSLYCSDGCQSPKASCPRADAAFYPCKK